MIRRPLRASGVFLILLAVVSLCSSLARGEATWTCVEWRGERAWSSTSQGWTAIVSEERARLVYLAPATGGQGLLYAEQKDVFSWGGHRFWLGPQSTWTSPWPPPADWEMSSAAAVTITGSRLTLRLQRVDEHYPQIERGYAWRGNVLHCSASWSDVRFQGIHILQLPTTAVVQVRREVTKAAPLGYVLLPIHRRPGLLVDREVSPKVAQVDGDDITLRYADTREKIGLPLQPIMAEVGNLRLTMRRGRMEGMSAHAPDLGMLTQVYLGGDESTFVEIEQLTPFAGEGLAFSEILIEPGFVPESESAK